MANIYEATVGGTLAREMARMEKDQASWRKAVSETDIIGKQARELAVRSELKALQSPSRSIAQQYKDLLAAGSAIWSAHKAWQESEHAQMAQMRKMFGPMADIRNSVLGDSTTQQLIKELTEGSSIRNHMKEIAQQSLGIGSLAQMLAQQAKESRAQSKKLFEDLGVGSSIQSYLKDFEHINKQWKVPNEVLGIMGSFKELQDQLGLGKVALPTIDWGSAAALAKAMGPEGIHAQLALLGIESDGSLRQLAGLPEKGILSKKQTDVITLISFLLIFVIFFYQEYNSTLQQVKTDAFQTQSTTTSKVQAQQIESLMILIEKALMQVAQEPEERLVVRERIATIRSKPEHGSAVEGKLMPNEVVRAIDKNGNWVEVEYYHWLHDEYRIGWVLKKYMERVPSNYAKNKGQ